jgi:hypothetical protein
MAMKKIPVRFSKDRHWPKEILNEARGAANSKKCPASLARQRCGANRKNRPQCPRPLPLMPGNTVSRVIQTSDAPGMKTIRPIPVRLKLPRSGEWVIAFTASYRTVACYRKGVWRDLIHRNNLHGVISWLSVKNVEPAR